MTRSPTFLFNYISKVLSILLDSSSKSSSCNICNFIFYSKGFKLILRFIFIKSGFVILFYSFKWNKVCVISWSFFKSLTVYRALVAFSMLMSSSLKMCKICNINLLLFSLKWFIPRSFIWIDIKFGHDYIISQSYVICC